MYATKAAADLPTDERGGNGHLRRLQTMPRQLSGRASFASLAGGAEPYRGWGRWIDMLGFRGHLATKSRRYSTALGQLRQARRDYTSRAQLRPGDDSEVAWADQDHDLEDTTLVIGSWRFAGMGWLTSGDAALAAACDKVSRRYGDYVRLAALLGLRAGELTAATGRGCRPDAGCGGHPQGFLGWRVADS
jgi:hypothetical protein